MGAKKLRSSGNSLEARTISIGPAAGRRYSRP